MLAIIDLFKLAQGEYIAVEAVETAYMRSPMVSQIWVWGDPLSNFLVAVVVPEFAAFKPYLQQKLGIPAAKFPSNAELCADPKVKAAMLEAMDVQAKDAKLLGFQKVRAIILESEPWTVESDLITPTMKNRRKLLQAKYEVAIKELYLELAKEK